MAISIFNLPITGRIDSILPDYRADSTTDIEKIVRILESKGTSSITIQDLSAPLRLDLSSVSLSDKCPFNVECIEDTLRLLHVYYDVAPIELFDKLGYLSDDLKIIEYPGTIEIHNGARVLFLGNICFCKIWCQKGDPLNAEEQKSLPCLPRIQNGNVGETTNFIAS